MPIKVGNEGEVNTLTIVRAGFAGGHLKLAKNDFTDDVTTGLASFDEADYPGYSEQNVTWSSVFVDASNRASMQSSEILFPLGSAGSPQDVYGVYFVVGGLYQWHAKFASPITVDDAHRPPGEVHTYRLGRETP